MTINILNVLQYHVPSTTNCVVTVAISFYWKLTSFYSTQKKKKTEALIHLLLLDCSIMAIFFLCYLSLNFSIFKLYIKQGQ